MTFNFGTFSKTLAKLERRFNTAKGMTEKMALASAIEHELGAALRGVQEIVAQTKKRVIEEILGKS